MSPTGPRYYKDAGVILGEPHVAVGWVREEKAQGSSSARWHIFRVRNDLKLVRSESDSKLASDMTLNCWYRSEMTLNYVMVRNDLKLAGPQ